MGNILRDERHAYVLFTYIYAPENSRQCYESVVCYKSACDILFCAVLIAIRLLYGT